MYVKKSFLKSDVPTKMDEVELDIKPITLYLVRFIAKF